MHKYDAEDRPLVRRGWLGEDAEGASLTGEDLGDSGLGTLRAHSIDKLQRARREASSRPLSLVMRSFALFQQLIALLSFSVLIARFSVWAMVLLMLAGLPALIAETRFSGDAFRLFRFRAPEARLQNYTETVMAREDHAKEVKLSGSGPMLLERYRAIFRKIPVSTSPTASDSNMSASPAPAHRNRRWRIHTEQAAVRLLQA